MKVLHITATDANGAGIAALRVVEAQRQNGIDANLLVRDKSSSHDYVLEFYKFKYIDYALNFFLKLFGLDYIYSLNGLFITRSRIFKTADIIHIHNIHHVRLLHPLMLPRKKRYLYTLHDMWAITGNCNYNYDLCDRYRNGCFDCPMNKDAKKWGFPKMFIDNVKGQWTLKRNAYGKLKISFVSPSEWLAGRARSSDIIEGKQVYVIPNCYEDISAEFVRKRAAIIGPIKILFIGQKIRDNDRKGFYFMVKALNSLPFQHEIHIVGKMNDDFEKYFTNSLTKISFHGPVDEDKMKLHYQNCHVFVLPSLQDNFPNTILESMCYATPVVAFNVGGINEIVNSSNGYLARYKDVDDLANGIRFVNDHFLETSDGAFKTSLNFSYKKNFISHVKCYNQLLNS